MFDVKPFPAPINIMPPESLPPLAVAPRDAARLLGVSQPTLARLNIPHVKTAGRVLYRVETLRQWLIDNETGETPP